MLDPGTGVDEARYFGFAMVMANHMAQGPVRDRYERVVLVLLVQAVTNEERRRGACRDTDLRAATRLRAWTLEP